MIRSIAFLLVFLPVLSFAQPGDFHLLSSHSLCDSVIHYDFESPTDSLHTYKYIMAYDESGRQITRTYINWDETENSWIANFKIERTYDSHGNETANTTFNWNKFLNYWYIYYKEERTWDENNNLKVLFISDGSGNLQSATRPSKQEYTYDANGKCLLMTDSYYDGEAQQWIKGFKWEYVYDVHETYIYHYRWDTTSSQWENYPRSLNYIYEINGIITNAYYDWDKTNSRWIGDIQRTTTYDAYGNLTSDIFSDWDTLSEQWINPTKKEYTYSPENEVTFRISSVWDTTMDQWRAVFRAESHYTGNGTIKVETDQFCTGDQWKITDKFYSYYSDHAVVDNIQKPELPVIKIYPNPAKEVFILESNDNSISSLGLFNANGQLVESLNAMQGINRYPIGHLKAGLYFIRITTPQGIISYKLLKE